jgi:hypothetical protein
VDRLLAYLRAIRRRGRGERRPDDDLDGCELDFTREKPTRDWEIDQLLERHPRIPPGEHIG